MTRTSIKRFGVVGLTLACLLAGCSTASKTPAPASSQTTALSPTSTDASASTSTTAGDSANSIALSTFTMAFNGGYSLAGSVGVGSAGNMSPSANGQSLPSPCGSYDSTTDTVVPFYLKITNTTTGFALNTVVVEASQVPPTGGEGTWAIMLDALGRCSFNSVAAVTGSSHTTLTAGQSLTISGYVDVPGYFTPSAPQGDSNEISGNDVNFAIDTSAGSPNAETFSGGSPCSNSEIFLLPATSSAH